MKKITLILTVFILIVSAQSYAQSVSPTLKSVDQVEYKDVNKDIKKDKKEKKRVAKRQKKAQKKHLKAMRNVAKADGRVTPDEKSVIKEERLKMQRKAKKRKSLKRKKNTARIDRTEERRNRR